jgi:transcriptional regulator GlxA family with amidase domain
MSGSTGLPAPHPLMQRLLAHIDAHLDDPALTPRAAAQALGVSVRRVHGLLALSPHSFSRLVARRRVQRAQELLAARQVSVIEVAFACGFNSLATFYRQYAATVGASPAGRRRRVGTSLEVTTPPAPPCTR